MRRMNCEIYPVPYRGSFRWKWRLVNENGSTEESDEAYPLFYECVLAPRSRGYQPGVKTA